MFGRKSKKVRRSVIHTPECAAIHEAVLMSLYFGYGAPSAPLFIPSGSLLCTCGDEGGDDSVEATARPINSDEQPLPRVLLSA